MHEVLNQVLTFNSEIKIGLWKKWYSVDHGYDWADIFLKNKEFSV